MKNITLVIFISMVLFSCKPDNKSRLGKELIFSDSLFNIENGDIKKLDINKKNHFYKIIVSLSGECPKCLKVIDNITTLFHKFKTEPNIVSCFLMDISDTSYFKNTVYPLLPQNEHYILNVDFLFQKHNKLMVPEIRYHAILLNESNIIVYDKLLVGNNDIIDYFEEINKVITNNK